MASPTLNPNEVEAIAAAAFEAHLGAKWDDAEGSVKSKWRDWVPDAIAGRNSPDGLPALEAAIVEAWRRYTAVDVPKVKVKAPVEVPVKAETPKKKSEVK